MAEQTLVKMDFPAFRRKCCYVEYQSRCGNSAQIIKEAEVLQSGAAAQKKTTSLNLANVDHTLKTYGKENASISQGWSFVLCSVHLSLVS